MKVSRFLLAVMATSVLGLASAAASAATIQGELGIIGIFSIDGGGSLDGATGLTFSSAATVIAGSDDLAAFIGESAQFSNVSLNSPSGVLFETQGGLTFTLTSLTVDFQTPNALDWTGTGFYSLAGFDDTQGTVSWTGDSLGGLLTFSSTSTAVVPVPGALLLFGSALLALRRKLT